MPDLYSDLRNYLSRFGREYSRSEAKRLFYLFCYRMEIPATERFVIQKWSDDILERMVPGVRSFLKEKGYNAS